MGWTAIEKAIVSGYNLQWLIAAFAFAVLMVRQALAARTREGRRMGYGVALVEASTGVHRLWWFAAAVLGPGLSPDADHSSPYLPLLQDHRWALWLAVQAYVAGSIYALHVFFFDLYGPRWWFWGPYLASLASFLAVMAVKLL